MKEQATQLRDTAASCVLRVRGWCAQARNRRLTAVPSPVNTIVITKNPPPQTNRCAYPRKEWTS
jgi:hypothetical protein